MQTELIRRLEAQIADLESRLPAHSTPPAMLARLEELEGELAQARETIRETPPGSVSSGEVGR